MATDSLANKHPELRALIDQLGRDLGKYRFTLDPWADDLVAQIIANADDANCRVYIALKLQSGINGDLEPVTGRYVYDCEIQTAIDDIPQVIRDSDDASYQELLAAVRQHFAIR